MSIFVDEKNGIDLISIIIPCYNAEKNIEKTLKSLEYQTYKNFEVIIINDGSTDSSDKIIKKYIYKSNIRFKYIVQKNSGVSTARNKGLSAAMGLYVMFLDSDDIYHANYVEDLYETLKQENVDTVYCCYTRDIESIYRSYKKVSKQKKIHLNNKELMRNFMYRKGPCAFCTFIYKKSIIDDYNIYFTDNLKYGEDIEFTWRYLSHCRNGVFIDKYLYGYYDNPDSAVNNINWRITDTLKSVKSVEEYIREYDNDFFYEFKNYMYDRTIWAILKDFARNSQKDLFDRLIIRYNAKKSMKNIIYTSPNILIKITAIIFCINPNFFYFIIRKL